MVINQNKKIAILTIDPSSSKSGGSIMGDKTRMNDIISSEKVFIRPSPNSGHLGGININTQDAIILFEAAGYKVDLFTSPHVQSYTERFIFESKEISEKNLFKLLSEVGSKNSLKPITVFEILTSAFYYYSALNSSFKLRSNYWFSF